MLFCDNELESGRKACNFSKEMRETVLASDLEHSKAEMEKCTGTKSKEP